MMFEGQPESTDCQICGKPTDGTRWMRFPKQSTPEAEKAAPKFCFCKEHRIEELTQWMNDTVYCHKGVRTK